MRGIDILLPVACLMLAGCEAGLSGGSFTNPGDRRATGEVVGSLRGADAEPAAGTPVFFRRIGETRATARTDELGNFQFGSVSTGSVRLVARTGDGRGAVTETTVFAGGTRRVPTMQLRPLEERPALLDVHGVGFEEQVTSREGDLLDPVYTSDFDRVLGARERGTDPNFEVVEIDPSTGRERVLVETDALARLDGRRRWLGASEIFTLADERYLVFRGSRAVGWIIYDLREDRVAFRSSEVEGSPTGTTGPAVAEGHVVVPHTLKEREIREIRTTAKRIRLDVFDLDRGTFKRGPPAGYEWSRGFNHIGVADGFAVIRSFRACTGDSGEFTACFATDSSASRTEGYFAVDLQSLEVTTIETYRSDESLAAHVPTEGPFAYTERSRTSSSPPATVVLRHNLETGTERRASIGSCPDCRPPSVTPALDAESMYAWWDLADAERKKVVHWDLEAGTTTPLEAAVRVGETERDRCDSDLCELYTLRDGTLRVQRVFERSSGDWWGAMVDVRGTEVVDRRVFDIWEGTDRTTRFDSFVGDAARADVEFMRLRRGSNGYAQYFIRGGSAGGAGQQFKQRTHLPAHHRDAALSDDGETLLYVTRDPETGLDQLFRLQLGAYDVLEEDAQ